MGEAHTTWIEVARAGDAESAAELALVLDAVGVPGGTARSGAAHVVLVRAEDAERARLELARYARENRGWPPRPAAPVPVSRGIDAAAVYALLVVAAYLVERRSLFGHDWLALGRADAALIRAGAWWRSVTALCLHADLAHLLGNAAFGALFGVMLAHSVGAGTAWLAFVLAGAAGNWLNAWWQAPSHASIGASTAVFGMLGMQVAYEWMRRRELRHGVWRRLAPLAIGAALLAWLGGGPQADPSDLSKHLGGPDDAMPRVDVGAHVLGFAFGALGGWAIGRLPRVPLTGRLAQAALAGASVAVVALAWALALRG